ALLTEFAVHCVCDFGKWGQNCSHSCDTKCLNNTCDPVRGQCNQGCVAGYKTPYCTEVCKHGQWGLNCLNSCQNFCVNGSCHHVTGLCDINCESGYQSPNCTQVQKSTKEVLKTGSTCITIGVTLTSVAIAMIVVTAIAVFMFRRNRKLSIGSDTSVTELCPEVLSMEEAATDLSDDISP
ncbi:unnamed protein product, partial [Lymnaea stagnalis]